MFCLKKQVTDLQMVVRLMVSSSWKYPSTGHLLWKTWSTIFQRWSLSWPLICIKMGPSGNMWVNTIFPFPFKQPVNGTFANQSAYTQEIHLKVSFLHSCMNIVHWKLDPAFFRHFVILAGGPWLPCSYSTSFFAAPLSKWVNTSSFHGCNLGYHTPHHREEEHTFDPHLHHASGLLRTLPTSGIRFGHDHN